ncbi:MAG: GNAT family N-acetyltransferase [Pseudomonadota bacterium]
MPSPIEASHLPTILRNNEAFVHWLSPLDEEGLENLVNVSDYAQQLRDGEVCLFAYDGHGSYRHKNVDWLSKELASFLYIDRVIIGAKAQRQGLGKVLYDDVMQFAREQGFRTIACEVNTRPDNPGSHRFHLAQGFRPIGEEAYASGVAVRYYARHL